MGFRSGLNGKIGLPRSIAGLLAMRLKLFPHSWLMIESNRFRVYVDPSYVSRFFQSHPGKIEFSSTPDGVDGLPEPLEKGDLILITHADFDHMNALTIKRLSATETVVAGPRPCVEALGSDVHHVAEGDELNFGDLEVEVVPAYNSPEGRSASKHHVRGESVGYVISAGGLRVYHAGDTDLIPEMNDLGEIDAAFLPIGGTYTMDIDEAVEAALVIEPDLAIPMHTRGQADPTEFVRRLKRKRASIQALAPAIGEVIEIHEKAGIS